MDSLSKKSRSENMKRIRSTNTKPELFIRKELFKRGFRYRLHDGQLPGKPDIVLKKYKTIIDVRGCFWHGHNCARGNTPRSNQEYWLNKIAQNARRDLLTVDKLSELGWTVIVVWECQISSLANRTTTISEIVEQIHSN